MNTRYPLSVHMAAFVEASANFAPLEPGMAGEREAYSRLCRAFTAPRAADLQVTDVELAEVPVRCYRPGSLPSTVAAPCVLYLHGGGWVVGDLDSHEFITAALAVELGCVVIAVDYRLAPEHPFPAAFDDCVAVWHALVAQASWLAVDPQRIVVAGDSAGGNLAAALCLALRDAGQRQPVGQALIYPGLGGAPDLPSRTECADAPLLSSRDVDTYLEIYVNRPEHRQSPYAMPLLATDFSGLAPAFIAAAQFDPLSDDSTLYAQRLSDAGVATEFYPGTGLVHGCLRARGLVPEVDALYAELQRAVRGFWAAAR